MPNFRILNRDLETSLYIFSLTISFVSITGFGIYRFSTGDIPPSLIDFSVSLFLLYTLKQVLNRTFTDFHKYLLVCVCMLGVIGILYSKGNTAIYWAYPPITSSFFFMGLRKALPLNVLFISIVLAIVAPDINLLQFFSVFITLTLSCIFGYIFSARTEYQNSKYAELADLDPLTNLKNRRSLKQQLMQEIQYHEDNIQQASLLILDLDHFKRINDIHGHTIGDQILVEFSKMLKKTVRKTDSIYRYGGEEFIIIANNTRLKNAGKLAEHIRYQTERTILIDNKPVTVSIGVAEVRKGDTDISWLHRADHALYRAKGKNRNLVYLAHGNKKDCTYRPFIKPTLNTNLREAATLLQ